MQPPEVWAWQLEFCSPVEKLEDGGELQGWHSSKFHLLDTGEVENESHGVKSETRRFFGIPYSVAVNVECKRLRSFESRTCTHAREGTPYEVGEDDRIPSQIVELVHLGIKNSSVGIFRLEMNRVIADGEGYGRYLVKDAEIRCYGKVVELWEDRPVVDKWFAKENARGSRNDEESNQRSGASSNQGTSSE